MMIGFLHFLINLLCYPFAVIYLIFYRFLQSIGIQPIRHNYEHHLALITGSGNGLGRELALAFANTGASLALWDIDDAGNRETKEQCMSILKRRNPSARVRTYHVDVTQSKNVYDTADKIRYELGQVSILVINAGYVSGQPLFQESDESTERTFAVNSVSPIWLLKAFLPYMLDANLGHVVVVSSILGVHACHGPVTYVSSKHASVGLTRSLRLEIQATHPNSRVSVHCICPYIMRTNMFRPMIKRVTLKLFFPILEPSYVAAETLAAIKYKRNEIILPYRMKYVGLLNDFVIPQWLSASLLFKISTRKPLDFFPKKPNVVHQEQRRPSLPKRKNETNDVSDQDFVCVN